MKMVLHAWNLNLKRMTDAFDGFTDEQMFMEIAPGKNRIIYLLGHMAAVHDMMLPLLGFGNREYTQLDEAFIDNPDKVISELPAVTELRTGWSNINGILEKHFNSLTPVQWFEKHTKISDEDFVKEPHRNKLSIIISRTNHLASHLGQIALVKK